MPNKIKIYSLAIFASMILSNNCALASIINIDTGIGQGADSYISSYPGQANMNFGSEDTMYLKNDLGSGFVNRKGYLRFDLSSVTETITNAKLSLGYVEDTHSTSATWGFDVYGLIDGDSDENWLESAITWNNAPANNTSSGGTLLSGQASLLGGFSIDTSVLSAGDIVNFSSSDLVNFLLSDTNNLSTLILVRQDKTLTNVGFSTKEHLSFSPPTLTLETMSISVPEPSIIALFAVGIFGIGFAHRKTHT